MEETVIDVPVWVILSVLAASSVATLCIVVLNYKRQSRYRSSQIISAMLENTSKYNDAIVNLSNGKTLTKIDKYGLSRIVYYMEILAQCRKGVNQALLAQQ
ncbi:MAG: hypothetical protein OXL96_00250 [Candidatus Poribacteria bacterium]|nr:hypothetical protein [Candidatus Poribacteria bacterium]